MQVVQKIFHQPSPDQENDEKKTDFLKFNSIHTRTFSTIIPGCINKVSRHIRRELWEIPRNF
jgi:hypothetical protein